MPDQSRHSSAYLCLPLTRHTFYTSTSLTLPTPPHLTLSTPPHLTLFTPPLPTPTLYTVSQCSYGCQAPPIPTNGRLANVIYPPRQLPSNSTYTLGSVAVFTCSAGYYLAGSGSRTCLENGVWSDQVTRCYPCKYCCHGTDHMTHSVGV